MIALVDGPVAHVELAQVIEGVLDLFSERFKNHGIELRFKKPETSMKLECRPADLSKQVMRLLWAALLRIESVEKLEEKWVEIEVAPAETGRCRMSVTGSDGGVATEFFSVKN